MRTLKMVSLFLVMWLLAETASAQGLGDKIVVIAEYAQLQADDKTVGSVPKGEILVVKEVSGDRFLVRYSSGHETAQGWLSRSDVLPPFVEGSGVEKRITTKLFPTSTRPFGSTRKSHGPTLAVA
jgi:hypothetical protein